MPHPPENESTRVPRSRRRVRRALWILVVVVAFAVIAQWPTTTRYGVNYRWYSKQIPLYEKAANFISRDVQTRRLLKEITSGASNEREIIEKTFSWVGRNIRPVPEGFPIIDDHVWHIIVRGYGADDQRTEVFTLLVSYGCCPATAARLEAPETTNAIIVAIVQVDGKPRVMDVVRGLVFENSSGDLAAVDDVLGNSELIAAASRGLSPHGVPYERYFARLADLRPVFIRMERQKPWTRLKDEVATLFTSKR